MGWGDGNEGGLRRGMVAVVGEYFNEACGIYTTLELELISLHSILPHVS